MFYLTIKVYTWVPMDDWLSCSPWPGAESWSLASRFFSRSLADLDMDPALSSSLVLDLLDIDIGAKWR